MKFNMLVTDLPLKDMTDDSIPELIHAKRHIAIIRWMGKSIVISKQQDKKQHRRNS